MTHRGTTLVNPYIIFEKINLSVGMRVADFGCGRTGHFVFPAARIVGDEGIVYAVDILKKTLGGIKSMAISEGFDNIQVIWSDIEVAGKMTIPNNSLDVVFFINVLSQIKQKNHAVEQAFLLLKKNGYLVIIDWQKRLGSLGPQDHELLTISRINEMISKQNLNLVETGDMGDYHYFAIAKKV
ncbi:MAG: methyltransferase domain-containing protein [bacterium]